MSHNISDSELVVRAKAGDHTAFTLIYERYSVAIYRYIYFRVGEAELAGGALQKAHPQVCFQIRHAPRQAGLGDAQRAARSGKAAPLHHFGEIQHVVEVLHGESE